MTPFKAEYNSLTGKAVFTMGDMVREMNFAEFADFHAVSCMLNAARQTGREEAAKECVFRMQLVARDMGVSVEHN
jgi:hypothetical protein